MCIKLLSFSVSNHESGEKKTRCALTIQEKAKIVRKFDLKGSLSLVDFAKTVDLPESTVRGIVTKCKFIGDAVAYKFM